MQQRGEQIWSVIRHKHNMSVYYSWCLRRGPEAHTRAAALCFTIRCWEAWANERLRSRSHKNLCADAKHICCYSNPQRLLLNRLWARKTNRARADGETRPILEKLVPESCFRFLYKNKLLVQKVHFYPAADHLCAMSEAQQKVLHFMFTCSSGYSVVTGKSKTGTQY